VSEPGGIVYFRGGFVPRAEAQVPIDTHAFNYGTGCFEGIRAYWSEPRGCLLVMRLREHMERLVRSARILQLGLDPALGPDRLAAIAVELLRRNRFREDCYLRPIVYKSGATIKVMLDGIPTDFCAFAQPMGDYLDTRRGLQLMISAWRRIDDNAIPARAKPTGAYVNAAMASNEARQRGFDEAIMLTGDGHVAEASSSNLFLVVDGMLVTPAATDDLLVGITRDSVLQIAQRRGIPVEVRRVDRSELLGADECFLCGTGVQIAPVAAIDGRMVGDGSTGPITRAIQALYLAIVHAETDDFAEWRTAVPAPAAEALAAPQTTPTPA